MKSITIRVWMLAGAVMMGGASLSADTLSSNFDCAAFGVGTMNQSLYGAAPTAEQRVAGVASNFSVVEGRDGRTILPKGTTVDGVGTADGIATVSVTLPAGTAAGSLDRILTYQGCEVLTHFFRDSMDLKGVRILARTAGETDYRSIEDFIQNDSGSSNSNDDFFEAGGPGPQPDPDYETWYAEIRKNPEQKNISGQSPTTSSGMAAGALAGRIIFTYGGHGRTWDGSLGYWRWQRGYVNNMMEDFGNVDGCDAFAAYCFNAGATIVPLRPLGYQNNEVIVDNGGAGYSTTGTWSNSVSTRYYGSGTPYQYAGTANTETATATFTPNIPAAGFYPIYTWANTGSDRVPGQLYRIKSTGGESQIRVDHRRVGCGWVYLGNYYFEAGSNPATGSVIVSNLNPVGVPAGSYVAIADAIRFGNGMGDANNGGGISGYSRREESTVYWIQNGWGNGGDSSIWNNANTSDDENLSWSCPPRMAGQMYRVHSDTTTAEKKYALYLGWHSNAGSGTARGSEGLITSNPTTNQAWWAAKVSDEVDAASLDEDANWQFTWNNRSASTYTGGYGEITDSYFGSEMDATIVEVAYHDNTSDAALLRDPKVRNVHGRAAYHAAVQYFNNFQGGTLAYLPEPPIRFRAVNNGTNGVILSWQPGPTGGPKGQVATGYRVYQSRDGLGFDGGTAVSGTTLTVNGLFAGEVYYFRVTGTNAGGESFPSDTMAVGIPAIGLPKILVVNGYDRIDKANNVNRGISSNIVEQLILRRNNSYDYVRQYASAINAFHMSFDSCDNESVINNDVTLSAYQVLVWISGEESSADKTFDATERTKVTAFLNAGGKKLFVSGAEIGYELDGQAVDPTFYNNALAADYGGDDGGSYQATGVTGTIFAGLTINFPASSVAYDADYPDKLAAFGGSIVCANYSNGGSGGAAVQFTGGSPSRQVVNIGFPFECIDTPASRNAVMNKVLTYFGVTDTIPSGLPTWRKY